MIISKTTTVAKLFFVLTFFGLLIYAILAFYSLRTAHQSDSNNDYEDFSQGPDQQLKYILIDSKNATLWPYAEGQQLFVDNQCPDFTCYVTTNVKTLKNKEDFDAVVVNVTDLADIKLPVSRPTKQRYIFYGKEPSDEIPVCRPDADNFFNYTWSYKLSSDIVSPFFVVQDTNGTVVAPSLDVKWPVSMTKSSLKAEHLLRFKEKSKAVAMIIRSCKDNDGRIYANRLKDALKLYAKELHIFGCSRKYSVIGVDSIIERNYFFVLVTSTSLAKDYVTDKVLRAYWNNAVPIVKAKTDLNKFLPLGSYVNAHFQTPEQIAALVHYSINNPSVYHSFFKWRNFYTIHRRDRFEGICQLCSLLVNDVRSYSNSSANLREWWESSSSNKLKCKN